MSIEAAEGYVELGLWEEAWDAMENLSPDEKTSPAVMRLRLSCAVHFEKWDMAEALACMLSQGMDDDRQSAAQTFQLLAIIACRIKRLDRARWLITRAVEAWPNIRIEIIDDPVLSEHLL